MCVCVCVCVCARLPACGSALKAMGVGDASRCAAAYMAGCFGRASHMATGLHGLTQASRPSIIGSLHY